MAKGEALGVGVGVGDEIGVAEGEGLGVGSSILFIFDGNTLLRTSKLPGNQYRHRNCVMFGRSTTVHGRTGVAPKQAELTLHPLAGATTCQLPLMKPCNSALIPLA